LLTPETSIDAQKQIGGDIIIPFDELPRNSLELRKLKQSLDRTHRYPINKINHSDGKNDHWIIISKIKIIKQSTVLFMVEPI
jgi:tRNA-guanine family transglycosylase